MAFKETGESKKCPTCSQEASKRLDKEGWWCKVCGIIPKLTSKLVDTYNEDLKSWRKDNARDDSTTE